MAENATKSGRYRTTSSNWVSRGSISPFFPITSKRCWLLAVHNTFLRVNPRETFWTVFFGLTTLDPPAVFPLLPLLKSQISTLQGSRQTKSSSSSSALLFRHSSRKYIFSIIHNSFRNLLGHCSWKGATSLELLLSRANQTRYAANRYRSEHAVRYVGPSMLPRVEPFSYALTLASR